MGPWILPTHILHFHWANTQYHPSLFLSFYLLTFNALFTRFALLSSLENGHSSSDGKCVSVLPLGIGSVTYCALGIIVTAAVMGLKS